jgi:hypothetical protein
MRISKTSAAFTIFFVIFGVACFIGCLRNEKGLDSSHQTIVRGEVAQDTAPVIKRVVFKTSISVYNPSRENTTGDIYRTADGSKINPKHPQRWAAVTQQWLKYFPYGSTIYVYCHDAPYIRTDWVVHDTGCSEGIDLLISNPVSCRIEFHLNGYVSNKPIE